MILYKFIRCTGRKAFKHQCENSLVFTRLFYLVQALDKITLTGWKKFSCYILVICYLCIPVSSSVEIGAFQLNLPIEPLLGISAILLFYTIDIKTLVLSSFIRHPLTLLALLYHLCMMISITCSILARA